MNVFIAMPGVRVYMLCIREESSKNTTRSHAFQWAGLWLSIGMQRVQQIHSIFPLIGNATPHSSPLHPYVFHTYCWFASILSILSKAEWPNFWFIAVFVQLNIDFHHNAKSVKFWFRISVDFIKNCNKNCGMRHNHRITASPPNRIDMWLSYTACACVRCTVRTRIELQFNVDFYRGICNT